MGAIPGAEETSKILAINTLRERWEGTIFNILTGCYKIGTTGKSEKALRN